MPRWTPLLALAYLIGCGPEETFAERSFLDQWWEPAYQGDLGAEILDRYGETCVIFESGSREVWLDTSKEGNFGPYEWKAVEPHTLKVSPLGKITVEELSDNRWKVTLDQWLSQYNGDSVVATLCDHL